MARQGKCQILGCIGADSWQVPNDLSSQCSPLSNTSATTDTMNHLQASALKKAWGSRINVKQLWFFRLWENLMFLLQTQSKTIKSAVSKVCLINSKWGHSLQLNFTTCTTPRRLSKRSDAKQVISLPCHSFWHWSKPSVGNKKPRFLFPSSRLYHIKHPRNGTKRRRIPHSLSQDFTLSPTPHKQRIHPWAGGVKMSVEWKWC